MSDIRDGMIAAIRAAGLHAQERDWSLGKTVIASRKLADQGDGIKYFAGYVCIFPAGDGRWFLDIECVTDQEETFTTSDAVRKTIEHLRDHRHSSTS